jgi:hypothetical protein
MKSRVLCLQKRIGILRSYFRVSDGGRSSMVEPQIVVLVVAGSSPVGHPVFEKCTVKGEKFLPPITSHKSLVTFQLCL